MSKKHLSADYWRGVIEEQRTSGLSAAAFCRRARVTPNTFYAWRRRFSAPAGFMEISVPQTTQAATDGALELRLGGRRSVWVRPGFDRRTLLELVQALESGA